MNADDTIFLLLVLAVLALGTVIFHSVTQERAACARIAADFPEYKIFKKETDHRYSCEELEHSPFVQKTYKNLMDTGKTREDLERENLLREQRGTRRAAQTAAAFAAFHAVSSSRR